MKKTGLTIVGLLILFITVPSYFLLTQLKIESGWSDPKEQKIVLANKVWSITFSEKLNEKSIHDKSVYVANDKGEKVSTQIHLSDDLKTIIVEPPANGYDVSSRFFTLHLGEDVKSVFGRGMNGEKTLQFIVQENLPIVGTKAKLNNFFRDILEEQKKQNGYFRMTMESDKAAEENHSADSGDVAQEMSETNIQVQGVDESDIVKTNGTHIFQVANGKVNIIKVNDGKKMILETAITPSQDFSPYQLFLQGKKLLVLGSSFKDLERKVSSKLTTDKMIAPVNQSTKAIVYDITNPKKPKLERELFMEGSLVASRKTDSLVYLVTNQSPSFWILEDNENADLRPKYSDSASNGEIQSIDYDKIQYFPESKASNYTVITSFDLDKPLEEASMTTYLGSGQELYMSKDNLYLSVVNWFDEFKKDEGRTDPITTSVFKFNIDGRNMRFHSSVEVEGTILNQFSMDEHEGYFRIATTKGTTWDEKQPSSNNLFIFDGNMKKISSLQDLARGERIYSARFMGDRIYIVTFKETDPLFVIDASKPEQPKIMGELKIPGFSNYLHPYDENHIIGFGQDTKTITDEYAKEPMIVTSGVKISLFDISDMSNPKEKFTEIIGERGTHSPLNYDHKALLFDKNKNVFAFPISVYHDVKENPYEQTFEFQGAYVYSIDLEQGFSLSSKISHLKGESPYEEWESEIQRLLYVDNTLFALSSAKITSYLMSDYTLKGELSLSN